jgi:AraC-like DNA-binding protein
MSAEHPIRRFSTDAIPQSTRLDFWMSLVGDSLWPVSEWDGISSEFAVDVKEARLGCLSLVSETMTGARRARRTRRDVNNSAESFYGLFVTDPPGRWEHNGYSQRILPGDVLLIGQGEHDSYMEVSGFRSTILKLPTHWVESWVPDPSVLVGRAISADSRWGRVLSPMLRGLTPELAASPPLPHTVLVDQLGATLALIGGDADASAMPDLLEKVSDCIRERCSEPELTADEVAASLHIPARDVHHVLAADHSTFASQLVDARVRVGTDMLASQSFKQLTIDEIAGKAGFMSTSHFSRAVRKRTGHTPMQLRRATS